MPKGLVRTFKVINVPGKDAKGKTQTGPLLSARLCDLDVLWQRAEQLCELSTQVSAEHTCWALPLLVHCFSLLIGVGSATAC